MSLSVYSTSRVNFLQICFSLPQLVWAFAWGGRAHFYGSLCTNTWCLTFWSLYLMPGSSSLRGCVLCGPLVFILSSFWPCKQESTRPVAQLRQHWPQRNLTTLCYLLGKVLTTAKIRNTLQMHMTNRYTPTVHTAKTFVGRVLHWGQSARSLSQPSYSMWPIPAIYPPHKW